MSDLRRSQGQRRFHRTYFRGCESVFSTAVCSICGHKGSISGNFHNSRYAMVSFVDQSVTHPVCFLRHFSTVQVAARTLHNPILLAPVSLAYHTSANFVAHPSHFRRCSGTIQVAARTLHDPIQLASLSLAYHMLANSSLLQCASSATLVPFRL